MTDVTTGQDQEPAELSAADEQVLRELTERARTGGLKLTGEVATGRRAMPTWHGGPPADMPDCERPGPRLG